MKALILLEGDLGEVDVDQQEGIAKMLKAFGVEKLIIRHNIDTEQILNCEFCMGT